MLFSYYYWDQIYFLRDWAVLKPLGPCTILKQITFKKSYFRVESRAFINFLDNDNNRYVALSVVAKQLYSARHSFLCTGLRKTAFISSADQFETYF